MLSLGLLGYDEKKVVNTTDYFTQNKSVTVAENGEMLQETMLPI